MITARFSNGHEDVYKGKRDVRAAWMVTDIETGAVVASGHSLDRKRAEKTAESNIRQYHLGHRKGENEVMVPLTRDIGLWLRNASDDSKRALLAFARAAGYDGPPKIRPVVAWATDVHNPAVRAARRARLRVEVIDL